MATMGWFAEWQLLEYIVDKAALRRDKIFKSRAFFVAI